MKPAYSGRIGGSDDVGLFDDCSRLLGGGVRSRFFLGAAGVARLRGFFGVFVVVELLELMVATEVLLWLEKSDFRELQQLYIYLMQI